MPEFRNISRFIYRKKYDFNLEIYLWQKVFDSSLLPFILHILMNN